MEVGRGDQWNRVFRRRRRARARWESKDSSRNENFRENRRLSSFFFSSFADNLNAKNMYETFRSFGDIDEVFIPAKRDARGGRYGFVRFFDVEDERKLAIKLVNIFIGARKLHVNLPRYQRRHNVQVEGAHRREYGKEQVPLKTGKPDSVFKPGCSYVDALNNTINTDTKVKAMKKVLCIVEDEDLRRFKKAFVGLVLKPGSSYNFQETLNQEGFYAIQSTPLGANMCLLEDRLEGAIQSWLADEEEWVKRWFKEVRPWNPSDVDKERITWIHCYGVPCHAWLPDVFRKILTPVGNFLCADDNTRQKTKMDVARVLVKTGDPKAILEDIEVIINGESFVVNLVEDAQCPLRCLPSVGSSEISDSEDDMSNPWQHDEEDEQALEAEAGEVGEVGCDLTSFHEKEIFRRI
ncbi:uncharacterized protein LOC131596865 [Vicia villosa]|uniref:uncharacterized protein LOC131596865 n=1 Tax=Vicia villosa TaxID=3911 RepID=UPI00273A9BF6|nr:uncharacterized protein LOC131596865 [Vicia villosa]